MGLNNYMKKYIISLIILLFILPQQGMAWTWDGHQLIVENIYDSMPEELQNKLDLEMLKEGSIAPDKTFKDFINHHYPRSYDKYLYYINLSTYNYKNQNYKQASFNFGVASHYISDSFVAPHYVRYESEYLHSKFEDQGLDYKIDINCKVILSQDLNKTLSIEASSKQKEWKNWLKTKDNTMPSEKLQAAQDIILSISEDTFSYKCIQKEDNNDFAKIFPWIIIAILLIVIIKILLSNFKKD